MDILLQVHIAQEETKHGFSPGELEDLLTRWELVRRDHIRVRGLMGMASLTEDEDRIRSEMEGLYTLFRTVGAKGPFDPGAFSVASMGMSSDVEVAVAAGIPWYASVPPFSVLVVDNPALIAGNPFLPPVFLYIFGTCFRPA